MNKEVKETGLVTVSAYAKLCGITYNAVVGRIYRGVIAITTIGGVSFIDTAKYPPCGHIPKGRPRKYLNHE